MISLINFGDSPFVFIFALLVAIFSAVLAANILAFLLTYIIRRRTQTIRNNITTRQ